MELFEIHITGDSSIINICKDLNLKTIVVDLVDKQLNCIRTEYMTSIVEKFDNYTLCKKYVDSLACMLQTYNVNIIRVKIESPYYTHYVNMSKYMETHFVSDNNELALSKNQNKSTYLATDRVYNHNEYPSFMSKYHDKDIELCLYDSFVEEDVDWLSLYN